MTYIGTTHTSKHNGHGQTIPRDRTVQRTPPNIVLIGGGSKSWPKANPTVTLPRAITKRQFKAAQHLKAKGGPEYLTGKRAALAPQHEGARAMAGSVGR